MKESTLQIECVEYLTILAQKHPDLVFFSIPNEALMFTMRQFGVSKESIAKIMKHFHKMGMLNGVPDFCVICKGYCWFIEFKIEKKKLSKNQEIIHKKFKEAHMFISIIDTFEKFEKFVKDHIYYVYNLKNC